MACINLKKNYNEKCLIVVVFRYILDFSLQRQICRDRRFGCYFSRENEVWQRVESASFYLNDKVISSLHLQKKNRKPQSKNRKEYRKQLIRKPWRRHWKRNEFPHFSLSLFSWCVKLDRCFCKLENSELCGRDRNPRRINIIKNSTFIYQIPTRRKKL